MSFISTCATVLAIAGIGATSSLANANEINEVRQQIKALQARLDQMADTKVKAATENPILATSGTSFNLSGFVQLDAIQDVRGNQGAEVYMDGLPLAGTGAGERKNTTTFSIRTSRLNLQTAFPVADTTVKTRFEFDFFTSDGSETYTNSTRPRVRHLYGEVGNWLVGQTWSTFMDLGSLPDLLEFAGPSGQSFIRQQMIRYTLPLGHGSNLAIAVENPESDTRDANGRATPLDRGPDLAANWTIVRDWGHVSLRGLVRPLRADDGTGRNQASATGWVAGFAGAYKLSSSSSLIYQFNAGKGAGRYIMGANPSGAYAASPAELSAQRSAGGFIGLQHGWANQARSTIVLSGTENDNEGGFGSTSSLNKRTREVHANYIWNPYKQVDVGLEYIWGFREQEDGQKGYVSRLQASARVSF